MGVGLLLATVALSAMNGFFVCPDWKAAGRFADIEAAEVVFEGVVGRIEEDRTRECAPDRVVFKVSRVWKGPKQPEVVLLQTAERGEEVVVDGQTALSTCPMWVEQDVFEAKRSYIIFATAQSGHLEPLGCGTSGRPTGATRKRLDAWMAEQDRKSGVVRER